MTVDGAEPVKTGFFLTGREQETDVRYEITLGDPKLEVELGEGIRSMNFEDGSIVTDTGIRPGTEDRTGGRLHRCGSAVRRSGYPVPDRRRQHRSLFHADV